MENENQDGLDLEETLDLPEIEEGEEDTTDWKAEAQNLRDKAISQRERTKALKQQLADARKAVEVVAGAKKGNSQPVTGELDETQLDYLDLKGISDSDELSIIEKVIAKTGQTVRQALKDDYVISKLEALRADKEVKGATPSSTKRGGNNMTNDVDYWFQKYDQDGRLPEGMPKGMAIQLVNRKASQTDDRRNPFA